MERAGPSYDCVRLIKDVVSPADIEQKFIRGGSARGPDPHHTPFLTEKGPPFVFLLLTDGTPFIQLFVWNATSLLTAANAPYFKDIK